MVVCGSISKASKEKAYDLVAHYFIYFVSCNQYNKCDVTRAPPSKCNNAANRRQLWAAIDQAKTKDRDFMNSIANLACNVQLNGATSSINEQAREAALRMIDINNVSDQVKCGYTGPKGGGGGGKGKDIFDMSNFLGLGEMGIYIVGGGFLMLMLVAKGR
jgi:hypothetical protein